MGTMVSRQEKDQIVGQLQMKLLSQDRPKNLGEMWHSSSRKSYWAWLWNCGLHTSRKIQLEDAWRVKSADLMNNSGDFHHIFLRLIFFWRKTWESPRVWLLRFGKDWRCRRASGRASTDACREEVPWPLMEGGSGSGATGEAGPEQGLEDGNLIIYQVEIYNI